MRRISNILQLLVLTVTIMAFTSCSSDVVYTDTAEVNVDGWGITEKASFDAEIKAGIYDVAILIRSTEEYQYQNLWLFVDTKIGNTLMKTDTIEGYLSDNYGRRTGQGIGSKKTNLILLSDSVTMVDTTYHFEIRNGMRDVVLKGISDVGVMIKPRKEETKINDTDK